MFGMTTHNENFMEVREELLHLIVDEDTRTILEAIIWKMNEVGDGSERIKQWCEEAQTYIPADSKYDEKYWVAAYILHSQNTKFLNLIEDLRKVKSQIRTLENDYNWLDKIKKEKLAKIDELYSKIKPIQAEIESLEEELESVDEASGVIAQSLWDLESERQMILFDLRTAAEKVIS